MSNLKATLQNLRATSLLQRPGEQVWIFDLDNTLHNASRYIFPHINHSMTSYLQEHLALTEQQANDLRSEYWQRYGATLSGLIRHHNTDPEHFLHHTHQFPQLGQMILRNPRLRHTLRNLPGKKLVFTNAPLQYARAVLKLLRINDLFVGVFAIEQACYRPKPQFAAFRHLLNKYHLQATRCVMVEDSAENLKTAKLLGMRTVWISMEANMPSYVDVKIRNVMELPRAIA